MGKSIAYYHLPGLFEFYEFYKVFLDVFYKHREYFYEWCEIGSIYGAPSDCLWGGGRVGFGDDDADSVFAMMREYDIPARLTFSNSLLREEHLLDTKCNQLCEKLNRTSGNGVIIYSDILLDYIRKNYPSLYFVSSTTKVITEEKAFFDEVRRGEFKFVVPDFRYNKRFDILDKMTDAEKAKIEFLCNECCYFGCMDRKECYENVSRKSIGEQCEDHVCKAPNASDGYMFSKAMRNPAFIGINDIKDIYLNKGFSHYKIEGRSLGSAIILEFLLYYMTKPEYQINVRELIYLDSSLDLF